MGFPVGYTELFIPELLIQTLSFLDLVRLIIAWFFRAAGLGDFLEPTDIAWPESAVLRQPLQPKSVSAARIRELLPVMKFAELEGNPPESCAVCLNEFEDDEDVRRLGNCSHIFHRGCLDRWMDHDQRTCPLCRTPFVLDELSSSSEPNHGLWPAVAVAGDFYGHYHFASGF